MDLYGLQKLTLLDYPGHVACTVFTGGCDFRCPYCHNYSIATGQEEPCLDEDELLRFLEGRRGVLEGVAITGGEPCLNPWLPDLIRSVKSLGLLLKLDTNGHHPDMLRRVLPMVDYVAMDIKAGRANYSKVTRATWTNVRAISESISMIMADASDYEFRTTVVSQLHTDEDFEDIGQWIRGAKRYFLQNFKDSRGVPFSGFTGASPEQLTSYAGLVRPYVQEVSIRGVDDVYEEHP